MKNQSSHYLGSLSRFSSMVVLSMIGFLLCTGTARAEDPKTLGAVVEQVKQKLAAGESREKVARYINDLVDR
ncbi:MAG: hypothetical protein PVH19_04660, partial [Planctomycetia bacterium]